MQLIVAYYCNQSKNHKAIPQNYNRHDRVRPR